MEAQLNHLDANEIFLDVIIGIADSMLDLDVSIHPPEMKEQTVFGHDVTCYVSVEGEVSGEPFKGTYAISWPKETYIKMANAMLMEEFTSIGSDNIDVGCELINIIFGNAKPKFNALGFKFKHTIPKFLFLDESLLSKLKNQPCVTTKLESDMGDFHTTLSMTFDI